MRQTLVRRGHGAPHRTAGSERTNEFGYYLIRVHHVQCSPADQHSDASRQLEPLVEPLTGVVERLNSGEKRSFADGAELLRLLSGWREGLHNMRLGSGGGKARSLT